MNWTFPTLRNTFKARALQKEPLWLWRRNKCRGQEKLHGGYTTWARHKQQRFRELREP